MAIEVQHYVVGKAFDEVYYKFPGIHRFSQEKHPDLCSVVTDTDQTFNTQTLDDAFVCYDLRTSK